MRGGWALGGCSTAALNARVLEHVRLVFLSLCEEESSSSSSVRSMGLACEWAGGGYGGSDGGGVVCIASDIAEDVDADEMDGGYV